ncbi:unnamed protein product [Linum trigynum]|uniref:AtC3H46-like PABC-like domain-containing protein n=1 Tax=Linum trigynum TaxID=586398 RepID=A0AAV2FFX2_9ROSI
MGYILIHEVGERDLAGLAFGLETFLLGLIAKTKTHLGLSPNTLSSATTPSTPSSPLNPKNFKNSSCPRRLFSQEYATSTITWSEKAFRHENQDAYKSRQMDKVTEWRQSPHGNPDLRPHPPPRGQ